MSPNGHWVATICRGRDEKGNIDAYLQVFNVQGDKAWSIFHADYSRGLEDFSSGVIYPFHWSKDDKYLYAVSYSGASGCCSMGGILLLVRLSLVTGQQTEIANYMLYDDYLGADFSISSSDRYILIVPQVGKDNLYILDTYTWKQRVIKLKVVRGSAGETLMSPDDNKVILVFREYPEEIQGDLTYGSIVLIDLVSGSQSRLISGMDFDYMPIPKRWQDNDHVLMYDGRDYWVLNIKTIELTKTEKP